MFQKILRQILSLQVGGNLACWKDGGQTVRDTESVASFNKSRLLSEMWRMGPWGESEGAKKYLAFAR